MNYDLDVFAAERAKKSLISTLAQDLRSLSDSDTEEKQRVSPEVEEELLTAFQSKPGVESLRPSYEVELALSHSLQLQSDSSAAAIAHTVAIVTGRSRGESDRIRPEKQGRQIL